MDAGFPIVGHALNIQYMIFGTRAELLYSHPKGMDHSMSMRILSLKLTVEHFQFPL